MSQPNATLYYIHDPMCSWCWGFRPVWEKLQQKLPSTLNVEYVVGGLAPDSDDPMPAELQQMIQAHWRTIAQKLGTTFNYDFWTKNTPRRSTYNACRAVIAASLQGAEIPMVKAIQEGYYLRALNPSNINVLVDLAKELSTKNEQTGLTFDAKQFAADLESNEIQQRLMTQISLARTLTEQGFPSLVLEHNQQRYSIPIDYLDDENTLMTIQNILKK